MGVRYVEVDVNSVDGSLIVLHGPPGTRRATPVGRLFAWIDYKLFYRDPLLRPQPLSTWLRLVWRELGVEGVLLDLKSRVDAQLLAREVEASGFPGRVLVSANDHRLLPPVARALPRAETIASFNVRPVDIASCASKAQPRGVGVRIDLLDEETAREVKEAGYLLSTWTVNSPEQALKALRLGADIIITDRPDIVEKTIASAGAGTSRH